MRRREGWVGKAEKTRYGQQQKLQQKHQRKHQANAPKLRLLGYFSMVVIEEEPTPLR